VRHGQRIHSVVGRHSVRGDPQVRVEHEQHARGPPASSAGDKGLCVGLGGGREVSRGEGLCTYACAGERAYLDRAVALALKPAT